MQTEKIKRIRERLQRLQQLIDEWNSRCAIPVIEKDLVLQQLQELYLMVKETESLAEMKQHPEAEEQKKQEPVSNAVEKPAAAQDKTAGIAADDNQVTAGTRSSKRKQPATLFENATDRPHQPEETLLDRLSRSKDEKTLADKFSSLPVSDLKKSIGINEKFKFINELFGNDTEEYNRFIEKLNSCTSSEEATRLVNDEYAIRWGWNKEEETFQSLTALIGRKFA
jgi:hypothetical protein